VTRLARVADRLATGSRAYARHLATRAAAWCARGRRTDLTGWRATLGVFVRLGLLVLGAYVLARLVRALPSLMWLLTGWWTLASWRAGKPADTPQEKAPEGRSVEADREAVSTLLLTAMGEADKVHLRAVLAHLHQQGQWEGRTVTDLRHRLAALDIPFDRSVKVAGIPTWGVPRNDLHTPSPPTAEEATPTAPTPA
jgi:hypothetical protein